MDLPDEISGDGCSGEYFDFGVREALGVADARAELTKYIGYPKCQDCGWKLGTEITDNCSCCNCSCCGKDTVERLEKHVAAFNRARELQAIIRGSTENS
jgi:hypothetical protein